MLTHTQNFFSSTNILADWSPVSESGCSSGPSAPSASDCDLGVADLACLEPLSEEAVLDNLYMRFKRDMIYVSYWRISLVVLSTFLADICLDSPGEHQPVQEAVPLHPGCH